MSPLSELPFGLTIDLSFWDTILNLPTLDLVIVVFAIIGWVALALVFFFIGAHLWLDLRQDLNTHHWQWVVLAVDVPTDTVQSPKAVEQIFAHLSGALDEPNFGQKYWGGAKQRWFSLEIISLEGYIQFLIYTEVTHRDLVEAAIYAQYPMAEITEVEDYVGMIPSTYPNETHNMFGIEFALAAADPYPIRTYSEFEHSVTTDFNFNDPMASILENFTRIGPGENLWFQIIIEPVGSHWKEKGIELVKEIIEHKKGHHEQFFFFKLLNMFFDGILNAIRPPAEGHDEHKEEPPGKISDLSPGVKDTIAAIEEKISKVGFKTKARVLYAANKEVFNPSRCLDGFVGSLNQFNYSGRNALVPAAATTAHYAFKNSRTADLKKMFVKAYKKRKLKIGKNPYILNTQELATLWHFPLPLVKTPLLQKTGGKRAEPPINLPIEVFAESPLKKKVATPPPKEEEPPEPPELMWG
ncbi:MAG: hypothetical protein KBC69_00660 [Candidatus Magasanikbacteria bacterium]|nr:hypothetical protein [Candidatus Magasanikbacteria bacterium]